MNNMLNPDERMTPVILEATMMARFRARFVKCIVKPSPTTLVQAAEKALPMALTVPPVSFNVIY
jgi:hypothetical protein